MKRICEIIVMILVLLLLLERYLPALLLPKR